MWFNPIVRWILRSPLHGLASKNTLLLTYTGRKTGKVYTTPVNYARDGADVWLTSSKNRTWWRNLIGGAPVSVRIRGKEVQGTGEAVTEEDQVAAGLYIYLKKLPRVVKYVGVKLDAGGSPRPEDVALAAIGRVMVRLKLQG